MSNKIDGNKLAEKLGKSLGKLFIGAWFLMLLLGVLANNDVSVPAVGFWTAFVVFYFLKVLTNILTNYEADIYKD